MLTATRHAALLLVLLAGFQSKTEDLDKALKSLKAVDIQKHQVYIASDELEGRDSGSDGGHKASLYIVEHLQKCGFEPAGADGGWFQPFGAGGVTGELADANVVRLFKDSSMKANELFKLGDSLRPDPASRGGSATGVVAYAPADEDWKSISPKGLVAMVPEGGDLKARAAAAEKAGATALLVVAADKLPAALPAWPPAGEAVTDKHGIPVVWITQELGAKLASAAGKKLADGKAFKGTKPVQVSVSPKGIPGKGTKNVLGVWKGRDEKLAEEYVVIGAHYDHVGKGFSRSNGGKPGQIHNGADDNGSGTSTLLEVAEAVKELKPRCSIVLMWFDGEENGLLGSAHWTGSPTRPIDKCRFMINLDMIGRNDIKQILVGVEKEQGTPKYPKLVALLGEAEKRFGIRFDMEGADDLIRRSDHWNFMAKGSPAVFFTGGLHADYHTERDKVEKINFPKEELIGKIAVFLAWKVANSELGLK